MLVGCGGSAWIEEPLPDSDEEDVEPAEAVSPAPTVAKQPEPRARHSARPVAKAPEHPKPVVRAKRRLQGRVLGKFRNTYYDFPAESEQPAEGGLVALKNSRCETIKMVPKAFYESVCVQGSGTLASGTTVSFAKRDCECAAVCPRTSQRICFDELDRAKYPWGRGATGGAITPLLTVAVDSSVIPLGTTLYIPEYDGLPIEPGATSLHDGCFIAQDRGIRITGKQVDIFTGTATVTKLWNQLVPSNQGVTVVVDNPLCARAGGD